MPDVSFRWYVWPHEVVVEVGKAAGRKIVALGNGLPEVKSLRSQLYRAVRDLGNLRRRPWRPYVVRQAGRASEGLPDDQRVQQRGLRDIGL